VRRFKPTENESPMLVVATTDVACVREPTSKERVNAASGKLIPLSNQCTAKAVTLNHDTLSSNGDVGNWGSVDDYATRELGCDSKTFAKDSKPVRAYYFSFGVPRADYDAVSFSDKNVVSIPALEFTKLGLPPFRGAQANPNSDLPGLLNELGDDKGGKIWVLGFASIAGDPSKNFDLSARRARALRQLLVRAGKAMPLSQAIAERIEFRGLGATFLAGMASPNDLASERVAVAFLCHFSGEPNTPSVEESP
jgi:hypothetical protein